MDTVKADEYGFCKNVDWSKFYPDTLRESIASLNPDQAAVLKYHYGEGLSYKDIERRCDDDSFSNIPVRALYTPSRIWDLIDVTNDGLCGMMQGKMINKWAQEYEKYNGHPHPVYAALQYLDSFPRPDLCGDIQHLDPNVSDIIRTKLKELTDSNDKYGQYVGHDVAYSVRDLLKDGNSGLSEDERSACRNFVDYYYNERLRSKMRYSFERQLKNCVFKSIKNADPDFYSNWCDDFERTMSEHKDLYDGIDVDHKYGSLRIQRPCYGESLAVLTERAARQQNYGKHDYNSFVDFMVDALIKYDGGKHVQALCDGSYKQGLKADCNWKYYTFSHICDAAADQLVHTMELNVRKDIEAAVSDGGKLDLCKCLRDFSLAPNMILGTSDYSIGLHEGLYGSNLRGLDPESISGTMMGIVNYIVQYDQHTEQLPGTILPVYGYAVNFDQVLDVARRHNVNEYDVQFLSSTKYEAAKDLDKIKESVVRKVTSVAVDLRLGPDVKSELEALHKYRSGDIYSDKHDYFYRNPDIEREIFAGLKEHLAKSSSAFDKLQSAYNSSNNGDGDGDEDQYDI